MRDQSQLRAAAEAWVDADEAYQAEITKYIGVFWEGDPAPPVQPITPEAIAQLKELGQARDAARDAFLELTRDAGHA